MLVLILPETQKKSSYQRYILGYFTGNLVISDILTLIAQDRLLSEVDNRQLLTVNSN